MDEKRYRIVFEDEWLIVVDKPSGLLVIPTPKKETNTLSDLLNKELDLRGAFRWGIEFDWAVDYLSSRRVDVRPLLSGQFPLHDAVKAFAMAKDKTQSTKVQVVAA